MEHVLGLIGAGNMAGAILGGVLGASLFPPERIWLSNRSEGKLERYAAMGIHTTTDNCAVAREAELLLLCVKPQTFAQVLPQVAPFTVGKGVVSISPGYSLKSLGKALPGSYVMRAMPNTPLLVGKGCTAVAETDTVPRELLEEVKAVFSAAGEVFLVSEEQMDTAISLSGSSPAFFFRMAGAMARYALPSGIDPGTAQRMAALAMEGAARMLLESGQTAQELTRQVCSPGGTTLAALSAFDELGFDETVREAMERCVRRSKELGV